MAQDIDPEALALLGLIRRHTHGGPTAPAKDSPSFASAYNVLISSGLIERSPDRKIWVISDAGERLLRDRYNEQEPWQLGFVGQSGGTTAGHDRACHQDGSPSDHAYDSRRRMRTSLPPTARHDSPLSTNTFGGLMNKVLTGALALTMGCMLGVNAQAATAVESTTTTTERSTVVAPRPDPAVVEEKTTTETKRGVLGRKKETTTTTRTEREREPVVSGEVKSRTTVETEKRTY